MSGEEKMERCYAAIDLKSFYASVECIERGLDPMRTNLVVADPSRSDKTICLAVSPPLKAEGIPGRPHLFEVRRKVEAINKERLLKTPAGRFIGSSFQAEELAVHPEKSLDFLIALPRMQTYLDYSRKIYEIYLKYLSPEDIHVYSVDEIFADLTTYLAARRITAEEMTARMVRDVWKETGMTAAAGIGPNLYLAKVAMDILAKHETPGPFGIRMASLNERTYREKLWDHQPITDFWRIGNGYARRLAAQHLYTMGDIARCSLGKAGEYYSPDLLYRLFGMNAELLIDHAWGCESCTMADIHAYRSRSRSVHAGQVLPRPYKTQEARLIVSEMAEELALTLTRRGFAVDHLVLVIGYDVENIRKMDGMSYKGPLHRDHFGRVMPEKSRGSTVLARQTASLSLIRTEAEQLFDRSARPGLLIRRILLSAENVLPVPGMYEAVDLFEEKAVQEKKRLCLEREKKLQQAILAIKEKFGKNAILKGMDLEEGASALERNCQIGGHHA